MTFCSAVRCGNRLKLWNTMPVSARMAARSTSPRFLPPWVNGVTDAVKGSALVSLLGVVDLMQAINQVIGRTYEPMPLYLLGALMYFAINYSLSSLSRVLERRYAYIKE